MPPTPMSFTIRYLSSMIWPMMRSRSPVDIRPRDYSGCVRAPKSARETPGGHLARGPPGRVSGVLQSTRDAQVYQGIASRAGGLTLVLIRGLLLVRVAGVSSLVVVFVFMFSLLGWFDEKRRRNERELQAASPSQGTSASSAR